jgi:hypothetical protein
LRQIEQSYAKILTHAAHGKSQPVIRTIDARIYG